MKKSFVTIYPASNASALYKDPGMIPFYMEQYGYESSFVSFVVESVKSKDEAVQRYRSKVKTILLEDDRKDKEKIISFSWSVLRYIWKNARKIDILNLYFLKHSIIFGLFYKLCYPQGSLYVKLDMDCLSFERDEKQWIEPLRRWVFAMYLKYVPDIVSVETHASYDYVRHRFLPHDDKLIIIPDGIDDDLLKNNHVQVSPWQNRKNIFLTIGRIGTVQKNNAMMLEAATKIPNWRDWEIWFVGPIEPEFNQTIESFYQDYPELSAKVHFLGPENDRKKLFALYNEAKVFCMSSLWESFGIVYVEAQSMGNYIVSTPVSSIKDFVEQDKDLGVIVKNADEMSLAMQDIIDNKNNIDGSFEKRVKHGEHFRWSTICGRLDKQIKKSCK